MNPNNPHQNQESCLVCPNPLNEKLLTKIIKEINWERLCDQCHYDQINIIKIPGCDHKFCSNCWKKYFFFEASPISNAYLMY